MANFEGELVGGDFEGIVELVCPVEEPKGDSVDQKLDVLESHYQSQYCRGNNT